MKSSPPSRSSRSASSSSATKRTSSAKFSSASAPPVADRGSQRRAKRKQQTRRKNWLVWLGFAATTAVIAGTALGVSSRFLHIKGIWNEYKGVHARVQIKQATLQDLRSQLARARKRLAGFEHGSGRERALAENGFVRPGERILLFPPSKPNAQ